MNVMRFFFLTALGGFFEFDSLAQTNWVQRTNVTSGTSGYYNCLACSADGSILAVASGDSGIFISTNSGETWLQHTQWLSNAHVVTMSADGNKMAAVASGLSTSIDGGETWTHQNGAPTYNGYYNFYFLASSADGNKLMGAMNTGNGGSPIYTSMDGGVTWMTNSAPTNNWKAGACSADGMKLIAVSANGGGVWTSTNAGATWISNSVPPPYLAPATWLSAASSADGIRLVIGAYGGQVYTSTNSGFTWISNAVSGAFLQCLASSADGQRLIAAVGSGKIYTSTNFGKIWNTNNVPSLAAWSSVASSADGCKLAAAISFGNVYTEESTPPKPSLAISSANGNAFVTWPVISTNVVLQASDDLSTWTDLTNTPQINATNLQDEVSLPQMESAGAAFYRLAAP
ncbi:MAG TPA: sialidase family protein [Verrucomicrobiae bacterium]|nr:sialidase family protein [Verrucomicrobiae bacterium]